jgi:hypothetical protein
MGPHLLLDSPGAQAIVAAVGKRWPWFKHPFVTRPTAAPTFMDSAAFPDFVLQIVRGSDAELGFKVLPREGTASGLVSNAHFFK